MVLKLYTHAQPQVMHTARYESLALYNKGEEGCVS